MGCDGGDEWTQVDGSLKYLTVPEDNNGIECWGVNEDDEIYYRRKGKFTN